MQYIVHKRFKGKTISGNVNIPALSKCKEVNSWIYYHGKPVCAVTSACAHQHFAINEDGMGMQRGKLTQAIQKTLAVRDDDYQARWDKVWDDPVCQKYKRDTYENYWLWNHDFFNADILTLRHIATLIGANA